METIYLCIIIFLFVLAVFDLIVGVSNDAVNFLNSAVGAKAASFKTILFIAGVGIFIGASLSNGMMDIARHGIYQPEHFYFAEIMCILLAVMLTDVVLLDVFNSMGMPTSTTVSLVFELLGGTFALALIKVHNSDTLALGDLINTDKALSVIMAIFVSVAIAFFFGMLVQWIARVIFTFNYTKKMKYSIALFGGIAATSIIYFMLIKGLKDSSFMTPENKHWIQDNTLLLITVFFVFFTLLMQVLHWLKVNVFKVVVLMGTFALALAFAGNDLVNFIGVPLAGFSSFIDYTANGSGNPDNFLMTSLLGPAKTPWYFLIGAGAIMVYALCTSKKAHAVIKTSVDLSRQDEGEETFGSTPIARTIVRFSMALANGISRITPNSTKKWLDTRFRKDEAIIADGAAFDLVRASVNLVLAGLLIALGTSLKLPLSTTYVTFMVAMGTSLADRAWGRDSAVYRITGVLSVIGRRSRLHLLLLRRPRTSLRRKHFHHRPHRHRRVHPDTQPSDVQETQSERARQRDPETTDADHRQRRSSATDAQAHPRRARQSVGIRGNEFRTHRHLLPPREPAGIASRDGLHQIREAARQADEAYRNRRYVPSRQQHRARKRALLLPGQRLRQRTGVQHFPSLRTVPGAHRQQLQPIGRYPKRRIQRRGRRHHLPDPAMSQKTGKQRLQ